MSSETDNVPLLDRQGNAHDEQPDIRFAIDDETGAYAEQSEHAEQSSQSNESHKYPPTAPPPSYREATGTSAARYHLQQLFKSITRPDFSAASRIASQIWGFIRRYWPTSRFAQLGMFMVGLWLLVIVSGPAFEEAGPHAGGGYPWAGIDSLLEDGPGPISGDGHIVSHANWTMKSCVSSKEHHGEVVCSSTTRIELDIPTNFHATDGIFVFADPPRTNHLTDGRGRVPGTIEVKLVKEGNGPNESPSGKAQVVIDAEYEQSRGEVFERSTVAKMAAGSSVSQGVGIYTYPLPPKYAHRRPPPLTMHITILIPERASIPGLTIQASAMSIAAFGEPLPYAIESKRSTGLSSRTYSARHASTKRAPTASTDGLHPPFFGRLVLGAGTSPVRIGKDVPITALGIVRCSTYNGDIVVEGDINSGEVRLETMTGNVRIERNTHVMAWRESKVASQTGNIELKEGSWFFSSQMLVKTNNGVIQGGGRVGTKGEGLWKTNKTLEMQTFNGAIHASYVVQKPTDMFLNPTGLVRVETESKNGNVDVDIVEYEEGTTCHAKITTDVGRVGVHMHRNFGGTWELEGSRGGSKVVPPKSNDDREFHDEGPKKDVIKVRQKGTIGKQDGASSVFIHSSLGAAQLSFE